MEQRAIEGAVDVLMVSRRQRKRLASLPPAQKPESVDDGYAIQNQLVAQLGKAVGWKVGATNDAVQEMLGLTEPFSGRVLVTSAFDSPADLDTNNYFMRGLEVEFAFRTAATLSSADGPFDESTVAAAVGAVHPAIEVIDSCFESWTTVGAPSLIADNGSHGALVLGRGESNWGGWDIGAAAVSITIGTERISDGHGRNALGHPLNSLVWLANDLARRGRDLPAGSIVTTGSCCSALAWAQAGDSAEAQIDGLQPVVINFV